MEIKIFYFNIEHAIKLHDWIINNSGGLPGNREIGLLDSALQHIQNDMYYPTFEEKLKHLVYAVNNFHPFNDGNKRSSLILGTFFLEINGYDYCIKKFVQEMEEIVVWLQNVHSHRSFHLSIERLNSHILSIFSKGKYSNCLN